MLKVTETAEANSIDLLWGVEAIASAIKQTPRQTHYQLEKGLLPAGKQGGKWVASHRKLNEHFAKLTSGKAA